MDAVEWIGGAVLVVLLVMIWRASRPLRATETPTARRARLRAEELARKRNSRT